MEFAKLQISGIYAIAEYRKPIPAGIIGAKISFEFTDSKWDNLQKTVVFMGYGTKDVFIDGNTVTIPEEVVSRPGVRLLVGVYGTDTDNTIAIPTLWADLGTVRNAADPSGDEAADPCLPIWAILRAELDQLKNSGATDEQIAAAVAAYLEENPVGTGTVRTVNDTEPDENGNVSINIPTDYVKTVNGTAPDENGNVEINIPDSGGNADQIPTAADLSGTTATFRNSAGVALFTLDLSGLGGSAPVYGNLVLSAEELTITEGQTGTFTVALDKAPTANQPVYLAVSDGTRLSVSPATLTFTPDNWETPQTVAVTSLEDDDEEDNAITVNLTSTSVDARQVAVAIKDNDVQLEIVADGLVLNMDYTGHVGDESDTIVDLASGLTFKNFSQFEKQETGITGPKTYKYLDVVADDAKTAFIDKVKATGGFSLESFGTRFAPAFYLPNYKKVMHTGNADGWASTGTIPTAARTEVTRVLQDGSTDSTVFEFGDYSLGDFTLPMNNASINVLFPYIEEFKHIVMTFSADGYADCYVNGVKNNAPASVENFQAWDFDTMFGGQWSLINDVNTAGVTTCQRIYNRVLTAEEVNQNMRANAKLLGLETF